MSHTITAPAKIPGKYATYFGPHNIEFEDGVATIDGDISDGLRAYLLGNGYSIDGDDVEAPEPAPEPTDSRDIAPVEVVGTPLRDAAVDPEPGDFLAPTNAGQGDPHGPDVVSPGIHANQDVRPVKAGDVHVDDVDAQDEAETEHAEQATDGTPVVAVEQPGGNASRDAWADYARANGASDVELEGKSRDDLREHYGNREQGQA